MNQTFDPSTGSFSVTFSANTTLASSPSLIFLNEKLYYPQGYTVRYVRVCVCHCVGSLGLVWTFLGVTQSLAQKNFMYTWGCFGPEGVSLVLNVCFLFKMLSHRKMQSKTENLSLRLEFATWLQQKLLGEGCLADYFSLRRTLVYSLTQETTHSNLLNAMWMCKMNTNNFPIFLLSPQCYTFWCS